MRTRKSQAQDARTHVGSLGGWQQQAALLLGELGREGSAQVVEEGREEHGEHDHGEEKLDLGGQQDAVRLGEGEDDKGELAA
eukprot:2555302-Prymnesium_polylepis.1